MIKKARGSQKGVAMLTATVIIIIVAGMSAAFLLLSFSQRKYIGEASESEITLHIAEAGVEDAINKMQAYATEWAKTKSTPSLGSGYDFGVFATNTTSTSITFTGSINGGTYSAVITNNKGTAPVFPNPFSYNYPTFTDPIWFFITATGTHGKNVRTLQVLTSAFDQSGTFKYGLFGDVEVDALGTFSSDGYDSKAGAYSTQTKNTWTFPDGKTATYINATGNLGSNGNIISNGNSQIMGNATPGPGATTSGGGDIYGSTTPATAVETLTLPPVTTTVSTTTGWTSGSMTVGTGGTTAGTGATQTLHWADMVPTGNGSLTINQDTILYVDGSIDMKSTQSLIIGKDPSGNAYTLKIYQTSGDITINGQAFAGTNKSAKNFQIYSQTTGTIKFNGGSEVYAAVDAPKAYFTNNGGNEFFGSMVAAKMKLSGTAYFHYDEDLASLSNPEPKFKIVSWRETAH